MVHARPALDRRQQCVLAAIALAIPVFLLSLSRMSLGLDDLRVVYAAAIVDIVLFGGGALWWVARQRGGLRALEIRWSRVVRGILIGLALVGLAARLSGAPLAGWLLVPLLLVEFAIGLTVWHAVYRSWRGGEGVGWVRIENGLAERLGPTLAAAAVGEIRVIGAALRALTLRPVRRPDGAHRAAGSSWRTVAIALVLVTVAEGLALHLVLGAVFGITHAGVHGAMAALHIWGVAWLLGDSRLMAETGHRVTDAGVDIELGLRGRAHVPWAWIERVEEGELTPPDRLIGERWPEHLVPVTASEAPNITLHLRRPATVRGLFGTERSGTAIALYLDAPGAFAAALAEARPGGA